MPPPASVNYRGIGGIRCFIETIRSLVRGLKPRGDMHINLKPGIRLACRILTRGREGLDTLNVRHGIGESGVLIQWRKLRRAEQACKRPETSSSDARSSRYLISGAPESIAIACTVESVRLYVATITNRAAMAGSTRWKVPGFRTER